MSRARVALFPALGSPFMGRNSHEYRIRSRWHVPQSCRTATPSPSTNGTHGHATLEMVVNGDAIAFVPRFLATLAKSDPGSFVRSMAKARSIS